MTTNGEDTGGTGAETTKPDTNRIAIIVLAVAVTILLGAIIGFIASGGLADDNRELVATPTTTTVPVTTTIAPATTVASTIPATTQIPGQLTIPAIEDTFTDAMEPDEINGSDPILEIEDEPPEIKMALVRFNVTGLPDGVTIQQVVLQFSTISSGSQVAVHLVDGEWNEAEASANNAPLLGERVGVILPQGEQGTLVELDVSEFVTGPGPIDFYLTALGDDTTEFASRDAGSGAPGLIVRWGQ